MTDRRPYDPYAPAPRLESLTGVVTPMTDNDAVGLTQGSQTDETGDAESVVAMLPADLDDITKPDLIALAELAGVATYGTKQDIADRIRGV